MNKKWTPRRSKEITSSNSSLISEPYTVESAHAGKASVVARKQGEAKQAKFEELKASSLDELASVLLETIGTMHTYSEAPTKAWF
jgi:hypothetical protein